MKPQTQMMLRMRSSTPQTPHTFVSQSSCETQANINKPTPAKKPMMFNTNIRMPFKVFP
ncbi:Uncharacterised protein [Segatella copri]|nr:Uncharacterised protein [Segatella copri]